MRTRLTVVIGVVAALFSSVLQAQDRRDQLIDEIIGTVDAKSLTRTLMMTVATEEARSRAVRMHGTAGLSPEEQARWRAQDEKELAEHRARLEELLPKIDHQKFARDVLGSALEENFDEAQLKELLAFSKSPTGRKFFSVIPAFSAAAIVHGSRAADEAMAPRQHPSMDEPKWSATMESIREIGTAIEAMGADVDQYPPSRTMKELRGALSPVYARDIPLTDAWGTEFRYERSADGRHYRLTSAGEDRVFEKSGKGVGSGGPPSPTTDPKADIVWEDGGFVRYPAEGRP
jgi:hypothetical protein